MVITGALCVVHQQGNVLLGPVSAWHILFGVLHHGSFLPEQHYAIRLNILSTKADGQCPLSTCDCAESYVSYSIVG